MVAGSRAIKKALSPHRLVYTHTHVHMSVYTANGLENTGYHVKATKLLLLRSIFVIYLVNY